MCCLTWMYPSMYFKSTLFTTDSPIKMHVCYVCSALTPWHSPMRNTETYKTIHHPEWIEFIHVLFSPTSNGLGYLATKCGILLCGITCAAPHLPCISFSSPAMFPAHQLRLCPGFFYLSPSPVFLHLSPPAPHPLCGLDRVSVQSLVQFFLVALCFPWLPVYSVLYFFCNVFLGLSFNCLLGFFFRILRF